MKKLLLLLDSMIYFDRQVLKGIQAKVEELSLKVELHLESYTDTDYLHSQKWDYVIADLNKPNVTDALQGLSAHTLVFRNHDGGDIPAGFSSVTVDNFGLADTALQSFKNSGYQAVGYYTSQQDKDEQWCLERRAGFTQSAQIGGFAIVEDIEQAITNKDFPIGVYCSSDRSARKLVNLCYRNSVSVPEQVSIIGTDYDDTERMLSSIPLSSVALNPVELGKLCIETLFKSVRYKKSYQEMFSSYELLHGGTTQSALELDTILVKAEGFIRNNFHRNIKIKQVTDHCRVSRKTLDNRFLQSYGKTAHQFITKQRLDKAKQLLVSTEDSIDAIAKQCGYPNQSYLSQVFMKELSTTPNRYRQQIDKSSL
ncbi:helix-turn-helix domain-containing protein [Vibrio breoganii]